MGLGVNGIALADAAVQPRPAGGHGLLRVLWDRGQTTPTTPTIALLNRIPYHDGVFDASISLAARMRWPGVNGIPHRSGRRCLVAVATGLHVVALLVALLLPGR